MIYKVCKYQLTSKMLHLRFQNASCSLQDDVTNFCHFNLGEGILNLTKSSYLKKKKRQCWCFDFLMSTKRLSYFNFQHSLDLDYPRISLMKYGNCPESTETASCNTSEWDPFSVPVRFRSLDLSKMFFGEITSHLADFYGCLHFLSGQEVLNWHGKRYVKGELVQYLNVLVKKHLRAQEPSFSCVWGYWNLVFISEAVWEKSHNQPPQNILPADKSLNEHLDHSAGSWVSTRTIFMISIRARLVSVAMAI